MARFVSKYQKYAITVQQQIEIMTANGMPMVSQPDKTLQFEQGGLHEHEVKTALDVFRFRGIPDGVEPSHRLSVYDTRTFAADLSEAETLAEKLRSMSEFGTDYIEVVEPRVPAPWPSYDKTKRADTLITKVEELGFDPADVLAYERQNQNRDHIVTALEALLAKEAVTAPEEVLA